MKHLQSFIDFINENDEEQQLTIRLSSKAVSSFEKDLKGNGIKYTKIKPTVFSVSDTSKSKMAIKMVKERFGTSSIIVESEDFINESENYKNHPDIKLLMNATSSRELRNSSDGYYVETPKTKHWNSSEINKLKKTIEEVNSKTSELIFKLEQTMDYDWDDDRTWEASFSFSIVKK